MEKSNLEGQYWAEEKLQGQKGQLTYIHEPTSVSLQSLPVFDALSFHNTFEDAKANEGLCALCTSWMISCKKLILSPAQLRSFGLFELCCEPHPISLSMPGRNHSFGNPRTIFVLEMSEKQSYVKVRK